MLRKLVVWTDLFEGNQELCELPCSREKRRMTAWKLDRVNSKSIMGESSPPRGVNSLVLGGQDIRWRVRRASV
jgi:hypothetical protein